MFNPHYGPGDPNGEVGPSIWESTLEQLDAHGQRIDGIDYGLRQPYGGGYRKTKLDGQGIAKDPHVSWKRKKRKVAAASLTKADLLAKYRQILANRYGIKGKRRSMAEGADPRNPASRTADQEMPVSVHDDTIIGLVQGMIDDLSSMKDA
jgi:hypothetical protein